MNKIIPFKKDIIFKTKVSDITSISLEHKSEIKNGSVFLEFIISGDYKMTEASINKETFNYNLPFEVDIDKKYDISSMKVDIDDFYYEIINNEILRVNISILLDNLELLKNKNKEEEIKLEKFTLDNEKTILDLEDENYNEKIVDVEEVKELNEEVIESNEIIEEEENIRMDNSINNNLNEFILNNENNMVNNKEEESKGVNNNIENKIITSLFSNINNEETFKTYHVYIMREEDTIEKIMLKYNVSKEVLDEYNNLSNIKIGDKIIIPSID